MNDLILSKETMSSLQIAEITGKLHKHVMRDIRNLLEQGVSQSNFGLSSYEQEQPNGGTKKVSMYRLTKKGCLILASGYNAVLREKIIDRWAELEQQTQIGGFKIPQSYSEALRLAADQAEQIGKLETQNAKLLPKADFADTAFLCTDSYTDIGQAAKVLNLPFGRNTLFKKLRDGGVFFASKNEPKQKYIDAGYFKLTQLPPIHRDNHPDIITMKVLCTQKGLAYINYLFGGTRVENKTITIE